MGSLEKQEKFLELFEPVRADLSRFAYAITQNREDAYDLVSDTVLAAYESFENIRKKEAFKSWLFTVASRLHKRNKWRRRFFGKYDEELAQQIEDHEPAPDSNLDVQMLHSAIDKLPEKQKEAIVLFEISGFSLEEIKDFQGGTLSGVKSRLRRARKKLAELLDADPGNTDYREPELRLRKKFVFEKPDVLRINHSEDELSLKVVNE